MKGVLKQFGNFSPNICSKYQKNLETNVGFAKSAFLKGKMSWGSFSDKSSRGSPSPSLCAWKWILPSFTSPGSQCWKSCMRCFLWNITGPQAIQDFAYLFWAILEHLAYVYSYSNIYPCCCLLPFNVHAPCPRIRGWGHADFITKNDPEAVNLLFRNNCEMFPSS